MFLKRDSDDDIKNRIKTKRRCQIVLNLTEIILVLFFYLQFLFGKLRKLNFIVPTI